MEERLCRCSKPLRPEQQRYCSQACRLEGMRAAKAMKDQPDIHEDEHERRLCVAMAAGKQPTADDVQVLQEEIRRMSEDWRRPKADEEARLSYHRRPPGWA